MLGFKGLELAHEFVEVEVIDFGSVKDVIEVFVVPDGLAQCLQAGLYWFRFMDCFSHLERTCPEGEPII